MELFNKIQSLLKEEGTVNITIKVNTNGSLAVCTTFSGHKSIDNLAPFMLKGSADELDKAYIDELSKPLATVSSIVSNAKEFEKSAQAAAKASTTAPASKTSTQSDAGKKFEEMRKQAEEKKKTIDTLLSEAKAFSDKGSFNTSVALYEKALSLLEEAKKKKEVEALCAKAKEGTTSFFCNDSESDAKKELKKYQTPSAPAEAPSAPVEETKEEPTEDVASDKTEDEPVEEEAVEEPEEEEDNSPEDE